MPQDNQRIDNQRAENTGGVSDSQRIIDAGVRCFADAGPVGTN
jgi:hypothetical protein